LGAVVTILIRKVDEPYGWLNNMSPHPTKWDEKWWLTSEAIFQAMRFQDEAIRAEIRSQKSPMSAQRTAKKHKAKMVVVPMSGQDLNNMRAVLRMKLDSNKELVPLLLATGDEKIIEDCSNRPESHSNWFWGACVQQDGTWRGENWLGKLWEELRSELRK
jgi:ribA/ribD-fused uncharacterized protein